MNELKYISKCIDKEELNRRIEMWNSDIKGIYRNMSFNDIMGWTMYEVGVWINTGEIPSG